MIVKEVKEVFRKLEIRGESLCVGCRLPQVAFSVLFGKAMFHRKWMAQQDAWNVR